MIRYVRYLIAIGFAWEEGTKLKFIGIERMKKLFGSGQILSLSKEHLTEQLLSVTFEKQFRLQKFLIRTKRLKAKLSPTAVDVNGIKSISSNDDISLGCRNISKRFGCSSSYTGWMIVQRLIKAKLLRIVKVKDLFDNRWLAYRFEVLTDFKFKVQFILADNLGLVTNYRLMTIRSTDPLANPGNVSISSLGLVYRF